MLVLQANREQEGTFNKLIQTMGEQIVWNGLFIVRDDELILEGTVRSLLFQFETKKVVTDLIDLSIPEGQILDVDRHPKLKDLINMLLYAFGKWGTLRGLRVEQDYPKLNQLFSRILSMYYIEPSFRKENFRFYKNGVRMTYEEVLQAVLAFEEQAEDDPQAESQGLWHKLVWKNRERAFHKEDTTLAQRMEGRIGNNFYLVGYECPKCSEKLHMAVYPEGKEVRIDTDEKGVYLARAYTCGNCNCFYTPRPDRLISEGLIYEMDFWDDKKAYEDYLELLGEGAQRTANFKYNEYEAIRNQRLQREEKGKGEAGKKEEGSRHDPDNLRSPQDAIRQLEEFSKRPAGIPEEVFRRFAHRVEEGFYPDRAVAKQEKRIFKQLKALDGKKEGEAADTNAAHAGQAPDAVSAPSAKQAAGKAAPGMAGQAGNKLAKDVKPDGTALDAMGLSDMALDDMGLSSMALDGMGATDTGVVAFHDRNAGSPALDGTDTGGTDLDALGLGGMALDDMGQAQTTGNVPADRQAQLSSPGQGGVSDIPVDGLAEKRLEKYYARMGTLDRLSERQKQDLKKQVQKDILIDGAEKQELIRWIEEAEFKDKAEAILKKAENSKNKTYVQMEKIIQQVERESYPAAVKGPFLEKLKQLRTRRGQEEIRQIMESLPQHMDRSGYQRLEAKLKAYAGMDLSPYQETLRQKREEAEKQEIAIMIRRARKLDRGDYVKLMRRLEEKEFAEENIAPYMDKIKEKVQAIDTKRIEELLGPLLQMDFNAAAAVYEQIHGEDFLPELKNNALEMLTRRLEKIRTDECELLVRKLQEEMQGTITENARHHFYPVRKVMLKTAEPTETSAIDAALAAYANDRSMFEYPIFSVDTSRNSNGREGMVLTPENLFYSTKMHAYEIPVASIRSIEASTGLLNRKLALEEVNGATHKLPYAVKTSEMEDWAKILQDFVQYLQEKPASRKLAYLAKETHDTICCYRCGYVYKDREVCPECGYKKNR